MKKRLLKAAVPALAAVLLAVLAVFLPKPAAFGSLKDTSGLDTPVRVGASGMKARMAGPEPIRRAIEKADLVADLTVSGWLGESDEGFGVTFFTAQVNKVYKGEPTEQIILAQTGNGKRTIAQSPLFQKGGRMILFLKKVEQEKNEEYHAAGTLTRHEGEYAILGGHAGILDVVSQGKKSFVIDRLGMATYPYRASGELLASDAASAFFALEKTDPVLAMALAEIDMMNKAVLAYEDVDAFIKTALED